MADQVRALESFSAGRRWVVAGDELPADDPIVKGREAKFESIEDAKPAKRATKAKKATKKTAAAKKSED